MARLTACLLLALAGCGDDAPPGPTVDAAPGDPTPQFDDGVMRIDVRSQTWLDGGDTTVSAALSTTPAPWPYDPPVTSGACRSYLRHEVNDCTPACGPDAMCDGGTCRPLPVPTSAGPLTVAGGGTSRTIAFRDGYQLYEAQPLFARGDEVMVSAPGATLPAFALAARVPLGLTLLDPGQLALAAGRPLTLRWIPAGDGDRIRILLGADLGHAQWRSFVIECDVPDDLGTFTVPQAMVDELADRRHWSCGDCFGQEVRRYRRADTTVAGTSLTLWVFQSQSLYLRP